MFSQYSKQLSFHESALRKTEDLVEYHLKCTVSDSSAELRSYYSTIMAKCKSKQMDMEKVKEELKELTSRASNTDQQLRKLMSLVSLSPDPTQVWLTVVPLEYKNAKLKLGLFYQPRLK